METVSFIEMIRFSSIKLRFLGNDLFYSKNVFVCGKIMWVYSEIIFGENLEKKGSELKVRVSIIKSLIFDAKYTYFQGNFSSLSFFLVVKFQEVKIAHYNYLLKYC
jgi:hypothetical protein